MHELRGEMKVHPSHAISWEDEAKRTEAQICSIPGIICECCLDAKCASCLHATAFHRCTKQGKILWRKGSIYAGKADYQRILYNLHRKQLPITSLKKKADLFIEEDRLTIDEADVIIQTIEGERSKQRRSNDIDDPDQADAAKARGRLFEQLTMKEMEGLLNERVEKMKQTDDGSVSDQYRVYEYIVGELAKGTTYLRVMIQASAWTGTMGYPMEGYYNQ